MNRTSYARRAAALSAALTLAIGVAACGDDDEEEPASDEAATEETSEASADAGEVSVEATEYDFELSVTPTADTQSVTLDNTGEEFHVLVFARINEGFTLDEAVKMQGEKGSATTFAELEAPPGKSATAEIKKPLEPGEYAMLCPIPSKDGPHYELGQLEEFAIE